MPIYNGTYTATITNGGGTINLDVADSTVTLYVFSGTANLSGSWVIQPTGIPIQGMLFPIKWVSDCTLNANNVTIFGTALTKDQALSDLEITAYYNGSAWDVDILDAEFSVTNGLQLINGTTGLGGTLTQDTTIVHNTNSLTFTGDTVNTVLNGDISSLPFSGLTSNEGSGLTGIFGRINSTSLGGYDEWQVAFGDSSPQISNGLSVGKTKLTLSVYNPTGTSQVGYTAYDGTGGFTHTADMFWYDVALDLDVTLFQAKETEAMMRFCYNTTRGSEEYNKFTADTNGFTFEATGGTADDKFITIVGMLQNAANDAAASALGVPVNGLYKNGSVVQIRVT